MQDLPKRGTVSRVQGPSQIRHGEDMYSTKPVFLNRPPLRLQGLRRCSVTFLLLMLCWASAVRGQDRLLLDVSVNGQKLKMMFDTGASIPAIHRATADRLGLAVGPAPEEFKANGLVKLGVVGMTEICKLNLAGEEFKAPIAVWADPPRGIKPDIDGFVGWSALKNHILSIDGPTGTLRRLDSVPREASSWSRLKMPNAPQLLLEVQGDQTAKGVLFIDTGNQFGVDLSAERWKVWESEHRDDPATLKAYFTPSAGLVVTKEMWAKDLSLGPLKFSEVPVSAAPAQDPRYVAVIGMRAILQLQLVIDGPNGAAYVKHAAGTRQPYVHNRLGATFVPDKSWSGPLRARVISGTPADLAGVREGDVLKKVDDLDVTDWQSNPSVMPLGRFFEKKSGTPLRLTLERDGMERVVVVKLKNILGPTEE